MFVLDYQNKKQKYFLLEILFLVLYISSSSVAWASNVTVSVNGQVTHQVMDGFGTTIRVFDDPHVFDNFNSDTGRAATTMTEAQENEILDLLYIDLGLTRVRPATDESIEPINDNNNPDVTDLSFFDFSWKKNDAFVTLLSRIFPKGLTNFFLSPIEVESWMNESNPEEYAEWAMAIINRWRSLGVEMPYYSIMNEPGYERGGYWSGEYIRDVIKILGAKLAAENFDTKIIVPDDFSANEAYSRLQIIMADSEARQYIGAFGYHLYGGSDSAKLSIKNMSLLYNIPVWMTEWSTPTWLTVTEGAETWATTMHEHISEFNVSAVDYMWGFFGEWEPISTHLVSLLDTETLYTGYRLNRNYYIMGQYSRFVKPGFVRIDVTSSSSFVRCTAFLEGSDYVQVCINTSDASNTIVVNMTGVNEISELQVVRSTFDGSENWQNLSALSILNGIFNATLPANSISTFYGTGTGISDLIFNNGFEHL